MNKKTSMPIRVAVFTENRFLFQKIKLELKDAAECVMHDSDTAKAASIYLVDYDCPKFKDKGGLLMSYNNPNANIQLPFKLGELRNLVLGDGRLEISVDNDRKCVRIGGKTILLTEVEFALFTAIYKRGGEFTSRDTILQEVWGGACDSGVINVYVHYLREKLEADGERIILCSRKQGYAISEKYTGGKTDA